MIPEESQGGACWSEDAEDDDLDESAFTPEELEEIHANRRTKIRKLGDIYELMEVIGVGAFGVVIKAREKKTKRMLAFKIAKLNPNFDQSSSAQTQAALALLREYKMLLTMEHSNIVKVFESQHKFTNAVIMEMELGEQNLEDFVDRRKDKSKHKVNLTEEQVAQIMGGVFKALHYLHDDMNIIHRDLKPENVLVCDRHDLSQVKLIDFGLAAKYSSSGVQDFAKCGTLLYTPPEQISNTYAYNKKADMWAAGVLMFELLTGKHPLCKPGDTKEDMAEKLKNFKEFNYPSSMSP